MNFAKKIYDDNELRIIEGIGIVSVRIWCFKTNNIRTYGL